MKKFSREPPEFAEALHRMGLWPSASALQAWARTFVSPHDAEYVHVDVLTRNDHDGGPHLVLRLGGDKERVIPMPYIEKGKRKGWIDVVQVLRFVQLLL